MQQKLRRQEIHVHCGGKGSLSLSTVYQTGTSL